MPTVSPTRVTMTPTERTTLWQRRLFEATAGLTRYLTVELKGEGVPDWLRVQDEIFSGTKDLADDDTPGWQRTFFRAQALMEQFVVSRHGHGNLRTWAESNAAIHQHVEPDTGAGAADPVLRVARQAELYGSEYEVEATGPDRATTRISHCAIWDYRERARSRGVPITLTSPCEYCTGATAANLRAKGFRADYELTDGPQGHGCRWTATRPA